MVFVERLGQEVVGPFLHGLHRGFNRAMRGHDDDRNIFRRLDRETLEDIKARAWQVRSRRISWGDSCSIWSSACCPSGHDGLVAGGLEPVLQHHDDVGVIVDNQNLRFHASLVTR